jgi:predicted small lipoprotein YifL
MKRPPAIPALLLVLLALAGCGTKVRPLAPEPEVAEVPRGFDDQALITRVLNANAALVSLDPLMASRGPAAPTVAPYARSIARRERQLSFEFDEPDGQGRPTTALVLMKRRLGGTLDFIKRSPDSLPQRVRRPLEDSWTRYIFLRRDGSAAADANPWSIQALSGTVIESADHALDCADCGTTGIVRVTIRSPRTGVDLTIEDPLQPIPLDQIPILESGAAVEVSVDVFGESRVDLGYRLPWQTSSGGAAHHTIAWAANGVTEAFAIPVSVLAPASLIDGRYDSTVWLLPFVVTGTATSPPSP